MHLMQARHLVDHPHTLISPRLTAFDMRSPGDANTYFFFYESLAWKAPVIQAMPWLIAAAALSFIELVLTHAASIILTALDFIAHSTWLHVYHKHLETRILRDMLPCIIWLLRGFCMHRDIDRFGSVQRLPLTLGYFTNS